MAAGFTTGAVLGGALTDVLSWRWAFLVNVVVAVPVLAVAPVVLAESRPVQRPRLDVYGAVTVTLALLALVLGLTRAGESSFADPRAYVPLAAAAVLLALFWWVEHRVADPLVPPAVLRRRTVGWGGAAGLLAFATQTSVVFLLTLYLQEVLGFSPFAAGLSFAALGVGTVLGGLLGPRVIARVGSRGALATGFLVQAVATAALVPLGTQPWWIAVLLAATFVSGVANLVAIVGFMVTTTSGLPAAEQGLATGIATLGQQVGITLGIPVMSAVASAAMGGGEAPQQVLTGVGVALAVNAAACAAAALLVVVSLPPRAAVRSAAPA